ncbi:membrane protein [Bacteroidia bacterium]|nr:membrane protein [Bacteroidia bacterium]
MKRLDYYIIKKFLSTFFLAIALIIVIVVVFDWSEKVNDFVTKKAPLHEIIWDYYVNFIPYFVNMFSALFVFIAVVFFTSKMAAKNEFVAFYSAGIKPQRILVPYLITALLLGCLNMYLTNFLIPDVNIKRLKFENTYIFTNYYNGNSNIHFQMNDTTYFYASHFDNSNNIGYRFSMENIDKEKGLQHKLSSETLHYDTANKVWLLYNYFERYIDSLDDKIESGYLKKAELSIIPEDFAIGMKDPVTMNYNKLKHFIEREKSKGSKLVKMYEYEHYQRIAHPFAIVILTFLGFVFSSKKTIGGIGANLAIGLGIAFFFIVFLQFSRVFALSNVLPVWFAAWLPIFIFGAISLLLLPKLKH